MSLLSMSFSGAVMIAVLVIVRALGIHRLPKRVFDVLWNIVLVRLLVPYSLPSAFSVYSLASRLRPTVRAISTQPAVPLLPAASMPGAAVVPSAAPAASANSLDPWTILWLIGAVVCAVFFAAAYGKCLREFRMSLPADSDEARRWLDAHRLHRPIQLRQCDKISAPLTYGVLRPVILMPKAADWKDPQCLSYVLAHEYVHIRRLDAVTKLALTAAVCVHWFNPAVWILYVLANRDLELSCDEAVVRLFGEHAKASYALALIRMEEVKSGLKPLCNSFCKNGMEERIIAIMKWKKTSLAAALAACVLVAGITTGLATSPRELTENAGKAGDAIQSVAEEEITLFSGPRAEKILGSMDHGVTWNAMTDEELSTTDVEWWTAEEYAAWLENEKLALQSCIGSKGWTPSTGWFTWDQQKVDETIALYEQTLKDLQSGMKLSMPTGDGDTLMFGYDPDAQESVTEDSAQPTVSVDSVDWADYAPFGLIEEQGKLFYNGKAVRFFIDQVELDDLCFSRCTYYQQEGEVFLHTVRQPVQSPDGSTDLFGTLVGIEEYEDSEIAQIAFLEPGALTQEATSTQQTSVDSLPNETGPHFMEAFARYAPFGVTFVKSGAFGNVYWNGEPVRVLVDHRPDGSFQTISSIEEAGICLQTVYDEDGHLIGVKELAREPVSP